MKSKQHSPLLLPVHLLLCLPAMWMLAAAADAPAGQRPNCPTKCGDVDIPFPFGVGEQCALHRGFELSCKTVNGSERLLAGSFEVTKISVADGKAWLKMFISWQCYDPVNGVIRYSQANADFTDTPYWISEVDNKIIVIGCNALAYMRSSTYVIGCQSTCNNDNTQKKGVCQADVPKGIQYYEGFFNENYNTTEIWKDNLCGYMVLMEEKAFEFKLEYLESTVFNDTNNHNVPIVLNWQIWPWTCDLAKENSTSYACVSSSSKCLNTTNELGYRCRCSNGYTGNPYITDGCRDIDECLDNVTYPCHGICENTPGSYSCKCHPGNSMMNGVCMPIQKSAFPAMYVIGLLLGLGVGSGTSLVLGVLLVRQKIKGFRKNKLRAKHFEQNRGLLLQQLVDKDIAERMIFSLEELEKATNKFDEARKLGTGGHGTVYKGILSSQHVVAIKKSKKTIQREIDDFINEVAILSQVNHRNVVRLLGCCLETEVPLLVYEFISNGTLSNHLHVEGPQSLSWEDRLRIALETASALAYLHSSASTSVIHRDVKSDNILLDDRLTAKVSDFGASRGIPIDTAGVTTVIQGTFGYLDPEYYQTSRLTDKSDVYSFGVILVELLTRKKPTSFMPSGRVSLIGEFNLLRSQDRLFEILDSQVLLEGAKDAEVVAALAATCISLNGDERPTMKQVEMRLQRLLGQENNTRQRREVDQNCTSTQTSHDEANDSGKHNSVEQLSLLSTTLPR